MNKETEKIEMELRGKYKKKYYNHNHVDYVDFEFIAVAVQRMILEARINEIKRGLYKMMTGKYVDERIESLQAELKELGE